VFIYRSRRSNAHFRIPGSNITQSCCLVSTHCLGPGLLGRGVCEVRYCVCLSERPSLKMSGAKLCPSTALPVARYLLLRHVDLEFAENPRTPGRKHKMAACTRSLGFKKGRRRSENDQRNAIHVLFVREDPELGLFVRFGKSRIIARREVIGLLFYRD